MHISFAHDLYTIFFLSLTFVKITVSFYSGGRIELMSVLNSLEYVYIMIISTSAAKSLCLVFARRENIFSGINFFLSDYEHY